MLKQFLAYKIEDFYRMFRKICYIGRFKSGTYQIRWNVCAEDYFRYNEWSKKKPNDGPKKPRIFWRPLGKYCFDAEFFTVEIGVV